MRKNFLEKRNCTRCSVSMINYKQRMSCLPMRNQGKSFENLVRMSSQPLTHTFLQRKSGNLPCNNTDDNELTSLNYFITYYNRYNPEWHSLEDLSRNMKTLSIIITMLKNYFCNANEKHREYLALLNQISAREIQDVGHDFYDKLFYIYTFVSNSEFDLLERQNYLRYANKWIPTYWECKRNLPKNPNIDELIASLGEYNDILDESYLRFDPLDLSIGLFSIIQNDMHLGSAHDCELLQIIQSPHISGKSRSLSISSAQEYSNLVNGLEDCGKDPDLVNSSQEESKHVDIGDRISEFSQGGINLGEDINLHFSGYDDLDEGIEHYDDRPMISEDEVKRAIPSFEIPKTLTDIKRTQFHAREELKLIPMGLIIDTDEEDKKDNDVNSMPHKIAGLEHGDFGGASDLFTIDFINQADRIKSFSNFESYKMMLMDLNKYPLVAVALKKYLSSCRSSPDDFNLNIKYLAEVFGALESEPKIMEIIEQSPFYELCVSDMQFWTVRKAEARKSSTSPVNVLIVHPQKPRELRG